MIINAKRDDHYFVKMFGCLDDHCVSLETPGAQPLLWVVGLSNERVGSRVDSYGLVWLINDHRLRHYEWRSTPFEDYEKSRPDFERPYRGEILNRFSTNYLLRNNLLKHVLTEMGKNVS